MLIWIRGLETPLLIVEFLVSLVVWADKYNHRVGIKTGRKDNRSQQCKQETLTASQKRLPYFISQFHINCLVPSSKAQGLMNVKSGV